MTQEYITSKLAITSLNKQDACIHSINVEFYWVPGIIEFPGETVVNKANNIFGLCFQFRKERKRNKELD